MGKEVGNGKGWQASGQERGHKHQSRAFAEVVSLGQEENDKEVRSGERKE